MVDRRSDEALGLTATMTFTGLLLFGWVTCLRGKDEQERPRGAAQGAY